MPIYEYHCESCNQDFECLVFGKEEPNCPDCNQQNVHRIMSACGFVSKGAGGQTMKSSSSSCSGCSAGSCAGCH